jgi:hypothetical protein
MPNREEECKSVGWRSNARTVEQQTYHSSSKTRQSWNRLASIARPPLYMHRTQALKAFVDPTPLMKHSKAVHLSSCLRSVGKVKSVPARKVPQLSELVHHHVNRIPSVFKMWNNTYQSHFDFQDPQCFWTKIKYKYSNCKVVVRYSRTYPTAYNRYVHPHALYTICNLLTEYRCVNFTMKRLRGSRRNTIKALIH